jgi:hypothetical protein
MRGNLMFPKEFAERFGLPTITPFVGSAVFETAVPVNHNRYLLAFTCMDATYTVVPHSEAELQVQGFPVDADHWQIFTHALHGSLVNCAWDVRQNAIVGPIPIIIIEAFMFDDSARERYRVGVSTLPVSSVKTRPRTNGFSLTRPLSKRR